MTIQSGGLVQEVAEALIPCLRVRFENHMSRHPSVEWTVVESALVSQPEKIHSLHQMEMTGGEPDVVGFDAQTAKFQFVDCSVETPRGRVSVCYDRAGLDSRKEHKPQSTAIDLATEFHIELLSEDEYRTLQSLGEFDLKTSSWLKTPDEIRRLGGALYAERRYGRVFVGHNGAQSYFNVRGFRGSLWV